jgi:hypothetical protein
MPHRHPSVPSQHCTIISWMQLQNVETRAVSQQVDLQPPHTLAAGLTSPSKPVRDGHPARNRRKQEAPSWAPANSKLCLDPELATALLSDRAAAHSFLPKPGGKESSIHGLRQPATCVPESTGLQYTLGGSAGHLHWGSFGPSAELQSGAAFTHHRFRRHKGTSDGTMPGM